MMRALRSWLLACAWLAVAVVCRGAENGAAANAAALALRFPWTPVHHAAAIASAPPDRMDLGGSWDCWPDIDLAAAQRIVAGEAGASAPARSRVPFSSIGFGFEAKNTALLTREFVVPGEWAGRAIKLKAEGMFERARIFVNGSAAPEHVGWTPFERDITVPVRCGEKNVIAVFLSMEGYAPPDRLRMRKGGYPDLGGIIRPLWIHAVPAVHVADITLIPRLENGVWALEAALALRNTAGRAASVELEGTIQNDVNDCASLEGAVPSAPRRTRRSALPWVQRLMSSRIVSPAGKSTPLAWLKQKIELPPNGRVTRRFTGAPGGVLPWSAENPQLYVLSLNLKSGGDSWAIPQRFGFRTIAIAGESFLVNGQPVQFRGLAYKGGRADYANSSPKSVLSEEVELMKGANVNTVRLGWAFRGLALHEVCDEQGLYVISSVGADQFRLEEPLALQQFGEAYAALKNSPSVLLWELQNENPRQDHPTYQKVMAVGRALDPHRKFIHPGASYAGLDLVCPHYQPKMFAEDKRDGRPFLPTEYAHVPAYELDKLKFDPGIDDLWGYALKRGWDIIRERPWVSGAITFAWRDTYYKDLTGRLVPSLHNEARWGVVDEYFRAKPEYHHLFKVYAPIRIATQPLQADGPASPRLRVENRYDFTNLSAVDVRWEILGPEGVVRAGQWPLNLPPGGQQAVEAPAVPEKAGAYRLRVSCWDAQKRLIQREEIPYVWNRPPPAADDPAAGKVVASEKNGLVNVEWAGGSYGFDRRTGLLRFARLHGEELLMSGPELNQRFVFPRPSWELAPATQAWTKRVSPRALTQFDFAPAGDGRSVEIKTAHEYATGAMTAHYRIFADGSIAVTCTLPPETFGVSWRFPVTGRRAIGAETNPDNRIRLFAEQVAWRRNGLWSWFPPHHVGANIGVSDFVVHNDLDAHNPANHSTKFNTAYLRVGPRDRSMNIIIRDPDARIHVKPHFWYNELELFVQGRAEDDYDYFDRTGPLLALPHALSEQDRTYSFTLRLADRPTVEAIEKWELEPCHALVERAAFWERFWADRTRESGPASAPSEGTIKNLPKSYPE